MITELSRFTVKKGKEEKALEWMTFLNTHMSDTLLTLKGEKMYVENIFSEVRDDLTCTFTGSPSRKREVRMLRNQLPG